MVIECDKERGFQGNWRQTVIPPGGMTGACQVRREFGPELSGFPGRRILERRDRSAAADPANDQRTES